MAGRQAEGFLATEITEATEKEEERKRVMEMSAGLRCTFLCDLGDLCGLFPPAVTI
jgi:hypothetical protein